MFRTLKRLAAESLAAFSIYPAFRKEASGDSPNRIIRADEFDESEVDVNPFYRPAQFITGENYRGVRMGLQDQLEAMSKARNKRYFNSCLGAREETQRFIAERIR